MGWYQDLETGKIIKLDEKQSRIKHYSSLRLFPKVGKCGKFDQIKK